MADRFAGIEPENMSGPITDGVAITPNDSAIFAQPSRVVYVGTGGHLVVRLTSGSTLTYKNVPSGSQLIIRADRVLAAGTTAADILITY